LEDKVRLLEERIKKYVVGISDALKNDIPKIMGGQNLECTCMKFFWEYHPQIIRFAWQVCSCVQRVTREWSFDFAQ
jgi:hypothetical protein